MDWKYDNFIKPIIAYFTKKGWDIKTDTSDHLEKKYVDKFFSKKHQKYLMDDSFFYEKINKLFTDTSFNKLQLKTLKNENSDTDLIIAGYQAVANLIGKGKVPTHASYYSFQPVIRLNNILECGKKEGFLTSFINTCLIDVNTSMEEYLEHIDLWITFLSKLSLHTSGIQLFFKKKTNAFNGFGVEFQYKGIEIGQANLYQYNEESLSYLISDFGFGYERLLWVINGGDFFFDPLFDKYDIMHLNTNECDRIRTAVLLIMMGIVPTANGVGKHSRMLLSQAQTVGMDRLLDKRILRYYTYYQKFIKPQLTYEQTARLIKSEIDYSLLKQKYIACGYSYPKRFSGSIFSDYETLYYNFNEIKKK